MSSTSRALNSGVNCRRFAMTIRPPTGPTPPLCTCPVFGAHYTLLSDTLDSVSRPIGAVDTEVVFGYLVRPQEHLRLRGFIPLGPRFHDTAIFDVERNPEVLLGALLDL